MNPERQGILKPLPLVLFLAIPLAWVLLLNIKVDIQKPVWFDELIVSHTALQPHLPALWKILTSGQSPHPPLNFLAVRCVYALFGVTELTTRLPSTVGYTVMEICLFFFVARRSNAACGTAAMLFPLATVARMYAVEAKPYGALLGWTGVALICWSRATGRWRAIAIAGMGFALVCATSSHFFGALLSVPIISGETVRSWQRRRVDWPIVLTTTLSFWPLAFFIPILRAGGQIHGVHPWQRPMGLGFLLGSMDELLAGAAAPVVLSLLAVAFSRALPHTAGWKRDIPLDEVAAAAGLALLPLVAACGLRLAGVKVMEVKYVITMVMGVAILFSWSVYYLAGHKKESMATISIIFALWGTRGLLHDLGDARIETEEAREFSPPERAKLLGSLPIVAEPLPYTVLSHYAAKEIAARLYCVLDPGLQVKYQKQDSLAKSMLLNPTFFGEHVISFSEFRLAHEEFLVYVPTGKSSWVLSKYLDDGAKAEVLKEDGTERWSLVRAPREATDVAGLEERRTTSIQRQ